jgi:hypothetical protein
MKLDKYDIWEITYILKKEKELMEQKAKEWMNDDEDDKSISLMCLNKAKKLNEIIFKLKQYEIYKNNIDRA